MTDACFLSPPAGARLADLKNHLGFLRNMEAGDPLVRLAIEDTERLISGLEEFGLSAPERG